MTLLRACRILSQPAARRLHGVSREPPRAWAEGLNQVGVDVPFLSVLTPLRGTPLYDRFLADDRLLLDRSWDHYNGYNVAFRPARMSPESLMFAHRELWRRAFSPALVSERLWRGARTLSTGGMLLSAAMNGFYGLKQIEGNAPATARSGGARIAHAARSESPAKSLLRVVA